MSRLHRILPVAALAAASLGVAASPAAAIVHPKLVSPRNGHRVKARTRPTFVVRDTARKKSFNTLFLTVSNSRKLNRCGGLKGSASGAFHQMHRRKGTRFTFVYKADFFDYPQFWLNRPGTTWYWQVYRIDNGKHCQQVQSKIRALKIVS